MEEELPICCLGLLSRKTDDFSVDIVVYDKAISYNNTSNPS